MVPIPLADKGIMGSLSMSFEIKSLIFRETKVNYDWDYHNPPAKQFIVLLDGVDGEIEITTSVGVVRRFKGGKIFSSKILPALVTRQGILYKAHVDL